MKYKALALDMDGTLLNKVSELEPHVITALRKAQDAGIGVYLVSGRMHASILPFWEELGLHTPIVSYNGAQIHHPGDDKPLYYQALDYDLAREIIEYCKEHDYALNTYYNDMLYTLKDNEYVHVYCSVNKVPYKLLPENHLEVKEAPTKALAIISVEENEAKMEEAYRGFMEKFSGKVHITTSSRRYVEFLPNGVNKASGLAHLSEIIGLDLSEWVAVGDGMNDYEMLMECGVGLAVKGSCNELLQRMDNETIISDLPLGGIEEVLEKYFNLKI